MFRILIQTILLFVSFSSLFGQDFNAQQKAWLYKIMMKTPPLKRNWEEFFVYRGQLPISEKVVVNDRMVTEKVEVWDAIEQSVIVNPEILSINFHEIGKTSPGLIADVSVKLSLWELYSMLKEGYNENPPFTNNKTAQYFYAELYKSLPTELQKNGEIYKKYIVSFYYLLNPSLSLNKKAEFLADIKKLSISHQKSILDQWNNLVNAYVREKSTFFFKQIIGDEIYFKGSLLAVGEGSGSSGLLGEYEKGGDGWINTGTGKGIGLFTYQMIAKRGRLMPKIENSIKIIPLFDEPTLLHLSLWGMDSSKKPLILVMNKGKSYLLFADFLSNEISPDPNLTAGISYLNRLVEFEQKKIIAPTQELNKVNGLFTIYNRESSIRESILSQLKTLELEIDSINKLENISQSAIELRRSKINVNLSNLNDKENRIKDLERKIAAESKKIDRAKDELKKMKLVLGNDIQTWTKKDSLYTFKDGTVFNAHTQDLIFFSDSVKEQIEVKLLAASFSLESDKKDEVQLYVNVTGGVNGIMKEKYSNVVENKNDTVFETLLYFAPDEFKCRDLIDENFTKVFENIGQEVVNANKTITLALYANGVDRINHPIDSVRKRSSIDYYKRVKNEEKYSKSRRVEICVIKSDTTYQIRMNGFADEMNSMLSKLSKEERLLFADYKSMEQSLNPMLSALRVLYTVNKVERLVNVNLSEFGIDIIPLHKTIKIESLRLVLQKE